jgi:hypothetical protein
LIIGPRRLALIGAIAAVALTIIFYPLLVQDRIDTDAFKINLTKVVIDKQAPGGQELILRPTFTLINNNTITLTTSKIEYDLLADGQLVTNDILSYEDIPVNGRPVLFPGSVVPLTHPITLQYADEKAQLFNKIANNGTSIDWTASGSAAIESGTTQVEKTFESTLQQ